MSFLSFFSFFSFFSSLFFSGFLSASMLPHDCGKCSLEAACFLDKYSFIVNSLKRTCDIITSLFLSVRKTQQIVLILDT